MDRLKLLAAVAGLAGNAALWLWAWPGPPPAPEAVLRERLASLSVQVQRARAAAAWQDRARAALATPPEAMPDAVVDRLHILARLREVVVTETSHQGTRPARLTFGGVGPYPGFAAVLAALRQDPAVTVDRIRLTMTGPGQVTGRIEAVVRAGPWEGPPHTGDPPDPALPPDLGAYALGTADLFGRAEAPASAPVPIRPALVYTGFFAEAGTPTVMLREADRHAVLQVGETTSGGLLIVSATSDRLTVRNQRGESWTIDMQTAP